MDEGWFQADAPSKFRYIYNFTYKLVYFMFYVCVYLCICMFVISLLCMHVCYVCVISYMYVLFGKLYLLPPKLTPRHIPLMVTLSIILLIDY